MNVGEYGIAFNLNVGYAINAYQTLSLAITRPDGSVVTKTNPSVTVGNTPLVTDLGTFAADQYSTYLIANGDLTLPGTYTVRLTYTDATKRLISDAVTFSVNP